METEYQHIANDDDEGPTTTMAINSVHERHVLFSADFDG